MRVKKRDKLAAMIGNELLRKEKAEEDSRRETSDKSRKGEEKKPRPSRTLNPLQHSYQEAKLGINK
jgi:hypothetical protein